VIHGRKNAKKGFDRSVDRAVELGLGLCYQQNAYRGVGWARAARLSPESRDIAVIGKTGKASD